MITLSDCFGYLLSFHLFTIISILYLVYFITTTESNFFRYVIVFYVRGDAEKQN